MDKKTIELYIQLWDIGKTICEGLAYLDQHPHDEQIISSINTGLQAVQPYISEPANFLKRFASGKLSVKSFRESLAASIATGLNELLQDTPYIERNEAEAMFQLWDEMPHSQGAIYLWMFNVCTKAAVCAPQESYEHTLTLLEEQPGLLSSDNLVHPGYVYKPSEQRTFSSCPICGGKGLPYFRSLSYQIQTFEPPHLPAKLWMRCGSCGNMYTWKYPEELLALSDHAETIYPQDGEYLTAVEDTSGGMLAIWSDILNKLCALANGNTLLEVGIGHGELLAVAQELGLEADGVEIMPEAAQKVANMLKLPIWCGDFLRYQPGKTYSIIVMGDVIEHVTDPEQALCNANRLLKEDGVLWLSTPNFESSFSRMRKFYDAMWMEPYHISYFSYSGLKELAERCGFTIREYSVSRRYNGSMELVLTKRR